MTLDSAARWHVVGMPLPCSDSLVIGVSMIKGGAVSWVAVAAVFLSNLPEGLSSAAGMKKAGRWRAYIFGVWGGVALLSGIASLIGYSIFRRFSDDVIVATTAVAAGVILSMIADTMIPKAFQETHEIAGSITLVGFLEAFLLTKLNAGM